MIATKRRQQPRRSRAEAEAMMDANRGLVGMVLAKYYPTLPRADFFHIGLEGLYRAAELFDESRGVQFSTYACRAIWARIKRFLIEDEAVAKHQRLAPGDEPHTFDDIGRDEELTRHAGECSRIAGLLLKKLNARERDIVLRRMAGETLVALGESFGVCKERIRQMQTRALEKIREASSYSRLRREFSASLARVSE